MLAPETFTTHFDGKMRVILNIDTAAAEPRIVYEIRGGGLGLIERKEVSWEQVNGLAKIAPTEKVAAIRASLR